MRLLDGRRLTGPNYLAATPLVLVEVALDADESLQNATTAFRTELARLREALGLAGEVELRVRAHQGGAVLAYPAPRDIMLPCVEMSEWAAASASQLLDTGVPAPLEPRRTELAEMLQSAYNPRLLALFEAAAERDIPVLWDDEITSLGHGPRSVSYPTAALPAVEEITWASLGRVPVVLITGTNGKTTSSRLLAHVARAAGHVVGSTSTDGVTIDGEVVERGDWTGPIAARRVLREPRVDFTVLETARGGTLRRGLAVDSCDAALLTNIAADHLGDYGIDDLPAMARTKGVIAQVVRPGGCVALNARDAHLLALLPDIRARVILFADRDGSEDTAAVRAIAEHSARSGTVVLAHEGEIIRVEGPADCPVEHVLVRVDALPITFGGVARYNVENVLGVVATAHALGFSDEAIVEGLRGFGMLDNPGRGQLFEVDGVKVVLDFGHNPDGVRAVLKLVSALRKEQPGKLLVIAASPGDRSDDDIRGVAHAIADLRPDRLILRELMGYLRGRELGVVPEIYRQVMRERGFADEVYSFAESELDGLQRALAEATPGDLVVLLVHMDQDIVREHLMARGAR